MKKSIFCAVVLFGITSVSVGVYSLLDKPEINDAGVKSKGLDNEIETLDDPKAANPVEALEWRSLAWRGSDGQIPLDGLSNAISQRDNFLQQQSGEGGFENQGIARLNWRPRGPWNVGGRTREIIFQPGNPNVMWAGAATGGVWKSTDAGMTWTAANGGLQNYDINALAYRPTPNSNHPFELFAGTGERYSARGFFGGGLFRSDDGGASWIRVGSTFDNDRKWYYVNRLAVSPSDSNIMLAAVEGTNEVGNRFTGIMRSINGGVDWAVAYPGGENSLFVAFDPNDATGMKAIGEVSVNGVRKCVWSDDAGLSWHTATRDGSDFVTNYSIELVYHKDNSQIVYAQNPTPGLSQISKSTDGGHNFSAPMSGIPEVSSNRNLLWVSPTNPDHILVGGVCLYRSTNGGSNIPLVPIACGGPLGPDAHVDMHIAVSDPLYSDTNRRVYVTTDGGIFRTNDIVNTQAGNGTWQSLNQTFQSTQFYGAAGIGSGSKLYGGTQDNGTLRLVTGNLNASLEAGGDGGFAAIDPTNGNYCYGESQFLNLFRSDCSNSVTSIGVGVINTTPMNFIAPFILDPNQPNTLLAGGCQLWRTDNVRDADPVFRSIRPFNCGANPEIISAIAVQPGNSNVIWVGQNDGKISRTANGTLPSPTPTWVDVDNNVDPNPLPLGMITRILIDKDSPNTVYVTKGGFTPNNFWVTTDNGVNWQSRGSKDSGLPEVPIRGVARHPNNPNKLYIGTEIGVFVTEDGGWNWEAVIEGPANVAVDEITFMSGPVPSPEPSGSPTTVASSTVLLAATHGRGLWTADVETPATGSDPLYDFDGDGRTDLSVFRPSTGFWHLERTTAGYTSQQFGAADDKLATADFDGDGKADISVFRPSNGTWYRLNSSNGAVVVNQYGASGDVPMPADFDADGEADIAVFRPSNGYWYIDRSQDGEVIFQWGISSDYPATGDFNGDGYADAAVFRLENGLWWMYDTTGMFLFQTTQFGMSGDIPVAVDYDGDGKTDISVWRPDPGVWYALQSSNDEVTIVPWGVSTDIPVPGDYDGDGKYDFGVWRPSNGNWYLRQSTNGYKIVQFGASGDVPIPKR